MYLSKTAARKKAYAKYAERGWTMLDGITGDDFHNLNSSLGRGPRYAGDPRTWTIPILPKINAPYPLFTEMNSWFLRYNMDLKPSFDFYSLITPQLRYSYIVLDSFIKEKIQNVYAIFIMDPPADEELEKYVHTYA
jgi:hypothetical protein